MYLLDTNVCIDFARGRTERLRSRMKAALPAGLTMSTITYGELSVGGRNSSNPNADKRQLNLLVSVIGVRPFDREAAEAYGRLARDVGIKRRSFDRLIAAHALSRDLILVTNDESDFADVPGLKVENWTL